MRIAHEKAHELDKAGGGGPEGEIDLTAQLRPVTMNDFWEARKKVTEQCETLGVVYIFLYVDAQTFCKMYLCSCTSGVLRVRSVLFGLCPSMIVFCFASG